MTILLTGGAGFIGGNCVLDWLSVKDSCSDIHQVLVAGVVDELFIDRKTVQRYPDHQNWITQNCADWSH